MPQSIVQVKHGLTVLTIFFFAQWNLMLLAFLSKKKKSRKKNELKFAEKRRFFIHKEK